MSLNYPLKEIFLGTKFLIFPFVYCIQINKKLLHPSAATHDFVSFRLNLILYCIYNKFIVQLFLTVMSEPMIIICFLCDKEAVLLRSHFPAINNILKLILFFIFFYLLGELVHSYFMLESFIFYGSSLCNPTKAPTFKEKLTRHIFPIILQSFIIVII